MPRTAMSYPDTTFSTPPLVSPTATVDGNIPIRIKPPERCTRHSLRREGCGPTGRKPIWVIADVCRNCGMIVEVYGVRIPHKTLDWVRRWNARIEREIEDAERGDNQAGPPQT